jgi:hypothetical protein
MNELQLCWGETMTILWNQVENLIKASQSTFRKMLLDAQKTGGLTQDRYCKYLSMQYHLTKDVQRHFYTAAGNHQLVHKKALREFLVKFALEEESHFEIALRDLKNLGREPGESPVPIKIWWAYFDSVVSSKPFLRLGATCILENVSEGNSDVIDSLFKEADYLNPKNTVFFRIHRHGEELPHGHEILNALKSADLNEPQVLQLIEGAQTGLLLYLAAASSCLE